MKKEFKTENTKWVIIRKPTSRDIKFLKEEFDFHRITLNELKSPSLRAKVERYDHYLFMVIHFPVYIPKEKASYDREIDFLITKNALVTVTYNEIPALKEFQEKLEQNQEIKKPLFRSPALLLYQILDTNLEFSHRQLLHIHKKINEVEKNIYHGKERKMIEKISVILRDILDCRRIIKSELPILESLERNVQKFFGKKYQPYFGSLLGKYHLVWQMLDSQHETIRILQETNLGLLSIRINEAIRTLTGFAVPTFVLTMLATIFGWRLLPLLGTPYDFWIFLGILATIGCLMLIYFKKKKWI